MTNDTDDIDIEELKRLLRLAEAALEAVGKAGAHWNNCDDCHSCDHCTIPACPPQSDQWCEAGSKLLGEALGLQQYTALAKLQALECYCVSGEYDAVDCPLHVALATGMDGGRTES